MTDKTGLSFKLTSTVHSINLHGYPATPELSASTCDTATSYNT